MELREMLERVKSGEVSVEEAIKYFGKKPFEDMGYAKLDTQREIRSGYPEVVYCSGKADEHLLKIFETLYREEVEVSSHTDINDEGQTVQVHDPEIGTTATVDGGCRGRFVD